MNASLSRDPLVRAAAAVQASEGLATKPCEECFRAGRELVPPDVYVARRIGGVDDGACWVVYECPRCGHGESYAIPPQLLLAADLRPSSRELDDETRPRLFYEVDDDDVTIYLDPADGEAAIQLGFGRASGPGTARARAAIDFLAGGDGRRA